MKKKLRINQHQLHSDQLCNKHKRSASKTAERDASKATKRSTGETTEGDAGKAAKEVQVKPQKRCKKNSQFKKKNRLLFKNHL